MNHQYDLDYATTPVHNDLVERIVLGHMMQSVPAVDAVSDLLSAADFYLPRHGSTFTTITALADAGNPTTPVAVTESLTDQGIKNIDFGYLFGCVELASGHPGDVVFFASRVRAACQRRNLDTAGIRTRQLSRQPGNIEDLADQAGQAILEVTERMAPPPDARVGDILPGVLADIHAIRTGTAPKGLLTGLTDYDDVTGGHKPGQLIVPAARPAMGKSMLIQNWATHCASALGRPAIIYSVEMTRQQMLHRILAALTNTNLKKISNGDLTAAEYQQLANTATQLKTWPLEIVDHLRTPTQITHHTRRARKRHGDIGLIAIDFLQRLTPETHTNTSRNNAVGDTINRLKDLALDLNTIAIVPSQLNRGVETRDTKTPTLADLRDSGEIEQAADIVVFIHRPDYYDPNHPRTGEADLDIAKHRQGPTKRITVHAQLRYARFTNPRPTP